MLVLGIEFKIHDLRRVAECLGQQAVELFGLV